MKKKPKGRGKTPSKSKGKSTATVCASPKPGTSGAQSKTSGPIPVDTCSSDDNFTDGEGVLHLQQMATRRTFPYGRNQLCKLGSI